MSMPLPHAGKDHEFFQGCPSELFSSWTAQFTCGCVWGEGSLWFRSSVNLFMMLRRASPSGFLPNIETSSDLSREFPDTSGSNVADGSRQTGGPFLLRNCVGTLRSVADSHFSITGSFLDDGRIIGSSSSSSAAIERFVRTRGLSSSSSSSSRVGAGYAVFCSDGAKVTCLFGWGDRSRDLGCYARLVKSNTICPIVEHTTGFLQRQNSVEMPQYSACFWNLLIATLDPIDRVQPRSRTTRVGWLARSNGTAAIHAVCLVPYDAVVEQEEASVKLEYQSSDSQVWPCPPSLGVSEAESPDWG